MTIRFFKIAAAAALLAAAGCATPESRIKKHPDLYEGLDPAVQAAVAEGRVAVGFSRDAVFLALGEPNRTYTRTTAEGASEVWSFTATQTRYDRQRADVRVRYRDADGRTRSSWEDVWVDVEQRQEYERLRIEFVDGVVTAIETLQP